MTGLPARAAWRHRDSREGFEVAFFDVSDERIEIRGSTSAVEEGSAWFVTYTIALGLGWETRAAYVRGRGPAGGWERAVRVQGGSWTIDGKPAPHLDGCLDVDLESSAMTNAFPVARLGLDPDAEAEAPAAWIRVDGSVEVLEQSYRRRGDARSYDYEAPGQDFRCVIGYAEDGLALDYPGIARRVL